MTLLVLAAGMGSRYGGLKQLDPMGPSGETLLDFSIFDARRTGFDKVVFVIRKDFEGEFRTNVASRYLDRMVVDFAFQSLDDLPPGVAVLPDRTKPWGTGHAILAARDVIDSPFLAINADDFYGREAYAMMSAHLASSQDFAMAGYRLDRTLSANGPVSRGVCKTDPDDWLVSVEEFTALKKSSTGRIVNDGSEATFDGSEPVSLNFWGFTPSVFPFLTDLFARFIEMQGSNPKSEFYIPAAVADMMASGLARVKVLRTNAEWFGVTHREDREGVAARLQSLTASGQYPSPLWS